jgi:hypothetical protein
MLLTPKNPLLSLPVSALQDSLRKVGFIGRGIPGNDRAFFAGERFLDLLIFAGCSVQIELTPPADGRSFCHVRFRGPAGHPELIRGRNTRPPRCPACRAPRRDWKDILLAPVPANDPRLVCESCGAEHPPWDWDWKGNAGFGRTFVQVEEIFPGEATPAPALTEILEGVSAGPWRHFYVQDE